MERCQVCGNEYDKSFEVRAPDGSLNIFDSFECAIHALAPECGHCGCKIIGHGVEADGSIYCCAHCARQSGVSDLKDRSTDEVQPHPATTANDEAGEVPENARMNPPPPSDGNAVERASEQSFPASDPPAW